MNSEAGRGIPSGAGPSSPSLSLLVERIRAADPSALEELYAVFAKGVRYYLWRQIGPQDLDDRVHDIFLIIIQAIQKGELREPERLMGFVRTIARRQVAATIGAAVQARRNQVDVDTRIDLSDRQPDPERRVIEKQNQELAMRVLGSLHKRDREVLIRFYLQEQAPDQICREMGLTPTQFRLIKNRAKARYTELGKRRLAQRTGFQP
jgi:RNA polymerase sigma-70 factor (ECF subfamily)